MSANLIDRAHFITAVMGVAPQIRPYLESVLMKSAYTVAELNTLFRYEVIRLSKDSMAIRDWLCDSESIDLWIYNFCQVVVPYILRHVPQNAIHSPHAMLIELAG